MKYKVKIDYDGDESWEIHPGGDFEFHREVGPAVIYVDGTKQWFKNGQRHRDDDLPAIDQADGTKQWWVDGEFIREEG